MTIMSLKTWKQHLNINIFKYACVGGVCTILDLAVFAIFAKALNYHYVLVSSTGFALATLLNYLLCIRFVFQSGRRFSRRSEIVSLYVVSLIGLLLNQVVLVLFVEMFRTEMLLSKILATGAVFLWNYFSRSIYVFGKG